MFLLQTDHSCKHDTAEFIYDTFINQNEETDTKQDTNRLLEKRVFTSLYAKTILPVLCSVAWKVKLPRL